MVNSIPGIPGIPERKNSTDEGQRWEEHRKRPVNVIGVREARGSTSGQEIREVGRG